MRKIRWGILGLGKIARDFAEALNQEGTGVYAAASRNGNKARLFAEEFHADRAYGTYQEMLEDSSVDVVYIATPHSNHFEYIMQCLNSGKHVLCEKAITVNSCQLQEAKALAKEKGLILTEAITNAHMPLYRRLQEVVREGKIGKIKMIQVNFGTWRAYDKTDRFFNKELAGGALLDIGVYALSFIRTFLTDKPKEIVTSVQFFETGVDEQSGIVLNYPDGAMATVTLALHAKLPKRGIVSGENGYIEIMEYPRADKAVIVYTQTGEREVIEAGSMDQALRYEVSDMNRYICSGNDEGALAFTEDVMKIMTEVRKKWGLNYPCE